MGNVVRRSLEPELESGIASMRMEYLWDQGNPPEGRDAGRAAASTQNRTSGTWLCGTATTVATTFNERPPSSTGASVTALGLALDVTRGSTFPHAGTAMTEASTHRTPVPRFIALFMYP
jgi:hypothetical protein